MCTWLNKVIIILIVINHTKSFLVFQGRLGEKLVILYLRFSHFELRSAMFIFAKVMRCLVKHWRINAIRIACFLDDGFGDASSYKMTLFHSKSEKVSAKRRFYYNQGKICLETISNFDLVTNKNKIKKKKNPASTVYQQKNCQL